MYVSTHGSVHVHARLRADTYHPLLHVLSDSLEHVDNLVHERHPLVLDHEAGRRCESSTTCERYTRKHTNRLRMLALRLSVLLVRVYAKHFTILCCHGNACECVCVCARGRVRVRDTSAHYPVSARVLVLKRGVSSQHFSRHTVPCGKLVCAI